MARSLLPRYAKRALAGFTGVALLVVVTAALPAAATTTLSLSSPKTASLVGVTLTARVGNPTGAPAPATTVNFYVHVEIFSGAPELLIGSSRTNAAGVASITYQPTWTGTQHFAATAVDATGSPLATASLSLRATRTQTFAGSVTSLRPDGTIGRWVVVALLTLLIGVWITLLATVVRVQQGPPSVKVRSPSHVR